MALQVVFPVAVPEIPFDEGIRANVVAEQVFWVFVDLHLRQGTTQVGDFRRVGVNDDLLDVRAGRKCIRDPVAERAALAVA